jgi:hypothetical protein
MAAIKAKRRGDVKLRRILAAFLCAPFLMAAKTAPQSDELLDIEAKTYDITVVRHSKSQRVYLFNDTQEGKPPIGRILLLKKDDRPVMAFRVLKSYPSLAQFAGTRVREYPGTTELPGGETYLTLEKITDVIPLPPTASEKADLKELEEASTASKSASGEYREDEILAYDPELDAGSSPPPGNIATDPDSSLKGEEEAPAEEEDQIAVEEIEPLDSDLNWLTFTLGFVRNTPPAPLTSGYFTGGGLRYAYTIKKTPYFRKAKLQDSIALEGGVFYYNVSNLDTDRNDSYTIVPVIGTLRYNLLVSESLGAFAYAGMGVNFIASSTNSDKASLEALGAAFPAFGVGLIYHVGPSWDARFDFGFDVIAAGLMLRF